MAWRNKGREKVRKAIKLSQHQNGNKQEENEHE